MADANNTAPGTTAPHSLSADLAKQIQGCINQIHEKAGRITACHASLLALAGQFDKTSISREDEGTLCPDFVFPTLLKSITPDIDGITHSLWDLENLLERLDGKKDGAA